MGTIGTLGPNISMGRNGAAPPVALTRIVLRPGDAGDGFLRAAGSTRLRDIQLLGYPGTLRPATVTAHGCGERYGVTLEQAGVQTIRNGVVRCATAGGARWLYRRMIAVYGRLIESDVANQHPVPVAIRVGNEGVVGSEYPFTRPPPRTLSQAIFRRGRYVVEVDTVTVNQTGGTARSAVQLATTVDRRILRIGSSWLIGRPVRRLPAHPSTSSQLARATHTHGFWTMPRSA